MHIYSFYFEASVFCNSDSILIALDVLPSVRLSSLRFVDASVAAGGWKSAEVEKSRLCRALSAQITLLGRIFVDAVECIIRTNTH